MDWEVAVDRGLLRMDCIAEPADIVAPADAFAIAAGLLARAHGIDAPALARRLAAREARRSTVVGGGVAMPHADAWGLTRPQAAFVRSSRPMAFVHAPDGEPLHAVLVLVAPRPATGVYALMLQHYHVLVRDAAFRARLAAARDRAAVWQLFREHEWNRDPGVRNRFLTTSLQPRRRTKGLS